MRYPASEKLEIIRLVEQSHLPTRKTLDRLGIPRRVWNRIPLAIRRYHESLANVTPADAYFCRAAAIIKQRERIKRQTIQYRRLQHRKVAA